MFKNLSKVIKINNIIQIHFHSEDTINFLDSIGDVANSIERELKRIMPKIRLKPALHRLDQFPYVQLEANLSHFELLPDAPETGYIKGFRIDAQNAWINSNNIYIDTWLKEYLTFLNPIFKKIGVKNAARIGILTTYQTTLDNINNSKIFVQPNIQFVNSVLNLKIKDNYNTRLSFETNEKSEQCRIHWDVAVTGKFDDLEEKITNIISDTDLDLLEIVEKF